MRPAPLGLAVAAALTVAACSGSDGGGSPATSDEDDPAPAGTSSPEEDGGGSPATSDEDDPAPTGTSSSESEVDQSLGPAAAPVRNPAVDRPIYFVMTDRFANGDPTNDTGGLDAGLGPLVHGFEPTDRAYHHGGDFVGLTEQLPYIADLGMGAIWITPPFANRFVRGDGTLEGSSSSYHGYWQIDFTRPDPHYGTEAELQALIDAAHDLDLHVYFDIVINHTGDVISYETLDGEAASTAYISTSASPYVDAAGNEFDPAAVAGSADFPELDPSTSFPRVPVFVDPADATVKSPEWLNDPALYHNRGNSTFSGESSEYGDFFGLDDLFTEHPDVVDGMIELYGGVIERYDIDGFRIDTMKHVNIEFWDAFMPAILDRAEQLGKPDFYVFGEVLNEDPIAQSAYTNVGVPATLDFIGGRAIERFVAGAGDGELLADAFDADDWFTDIDNNASMQAAFVGNHDEGRMGFLLDRADVAADDATLLERAKLVNDLLFLTRGTPVVYYGDEQGFVGEGGDQLARHDMFPSVTPDYLDDDLIGTDATAADDNFDSTHPLYEHIADLAAFRRARPTFSTGAQIVHEVEGSVFAVSRIDRDDRIEHVVVANSSDVEQAVSVSPLSEATVFKVARGPLDNASVVESGGSVDLLVPARSTVVLIATDRVPIPESEPDVTLVRPTDGAEIPTPRYRFEAELADRRYAEVTFAVAVDGGEPVAIGTDDAPPYRVYWDSTDHPAGTAVDVVATVDDGSGRLRSDVVTVTLGDRS